MTNKPFKYTFGPVPSRRLGRSLGVDVVPFKTCTFNCIYCQLGETTRWTLDRGEYAPLEEVVDEIRRRLEEGAAPDYITISGSGEPTLYSRLGDLIAAIKAMTTIPVAVITNGSLLWMPEVQDDLLPADLVIPSLDAATAGSFNYVNRPHPELTLDKILEGLLAFRQRFTKQLWLEVFLLDGITALDDEIEQLVALTRRIRPDRIQLNTVVRPPAKRFACPVPRDEMERFARLFGDNAEVIAGAETLHTKHSPPIAGRDVLNLLRRRPCSLADITTGLGIHPLEASHHVQALLEDGAIMAQEQNGATFYLVKDGREQTNK